MKRGKGGGGGRGESKLWALGHCFAREVDRLGKKSGGGVARPPPGGGKGKGGGGGGGVHTDMHIWALRHCSA